MDEYGNDDGWTSNYDEDSYYAPDDQYESVATVSGDSQYDLPNTYGYDDGLGYGQTSNIDYSQYNPYEGDWQDKAGLTPNQSIDPNQQQPQWYQNLLSGQGQQALPQIAPPAQSNGISSLLSQLFGAGGKFLAAGVEGAQNKKKQQAYNNIANDSRLDPFGSERPFYQQQARQAVTDPYASPIVRMQTDELLRQANIGGAAHGRTRIQNLSPALLAEQAKVAQSYQEQMARQGGYQHGPNGGAISAALMGGANAGINGYASPLASALGYTSQSSNNNDQLVSALKTLIANGK